MGGVRLRITQTPYRVAYLGPLPQASFKNPTNDARMSESLSSGFSRCFGVFGRIRNPFYLQFGSGRPLYSSIFIITCDGTRLKSPADPDILCNTIRIRNGKFGSNATPRENQQTDCRPSA